MKEHHASEDCSVVAAKSLLWRSFGRHGAATQGRGLSKREQLMPSVAREFSYHEGWEKVFAFDDKEILPKTFRSESLKQKWMEEETPIVLRKSNWIDWDVILFDEKYPPSHTRVWLFYFKSGRKFSISGRKKLM